METGRVCGRIPARTLKLRRHVGMVVLQKFFKVEMPLCNEHGRELAKSWLGKTLVQGWWGVISFFVNFFAVYTDVVALSQASRLGDPVLPQATTPSPTA